MTLFAPIWWFRRCFALLGLAALFLSGCVPPTYPPYQPLPSGEVIGCLEATGPNVIYNNRRITGGGHSIRSGDNVSTGPNSRATVRLTGGGVVTIDANTDPDFIRESWCILVKILKGQVHTSGPGICFETPHASGVFNSEVNTRVTHQETTITVLTGSADINRPVDLRVNSSEQVRIAMGRIQQIRSLSKNELRSVFRWIRNLPLPDDRSDSRRCRNYAETAVSQQHQNLDRRCGFSGGRWLADFNAHYQWCMQVPQSAVENENRARAQALRQHCAAAVPPADNRQRCEQYAKTAISQQNDNLRSKCGFRGNRWSRDSNLHFRWCTQVPQSTVEAETMARSRELQRCSYRGQIFQ